MAQANKGGQQVKKYLVFMLMFMAFGISMWLIFAPSDADKELQMQQAGFNSEIPDPKNAGIIGDKKSAYEQEHMRIRQEQKRQSLQEYDFGTDSQQEEEYESDDTEPYSEPNSDAYSSEAAHPERRVSSFETSNSAYHDISRTLGNFYEEPTEDPEKEELREQVEQLKNSLTQQQTASSNYDEQVALLEKSYELTAKYMPQGQPGIAAPSANVNDPATNGVKNGKAQVVPIGQVVVPVVSALSQPLSQREVIASFSQPRNMGFNTPVGDGELLSKNTILACVHGTQTVIDGQTVRLRLLEEMRAGTVILPRNAIITGQCKIEGERLGISVTSLEYEGTILPVDLTVYDSDGQVGIFIPGSMEMSAVKEVAANLGQNLGTTVSITNQSAGDQLLSELGKGAIQGASQYISKKIQVVKVHLKAGYRLMLLQNKN